MKLIVYFLAVPFVLFCIYVAVMNRHSKNMTVRQMILKAVYPGYRWFSSKFSKTAPIVARKDSRPAVSFYSLKGTLITGEDFAFDQLREKKVLLVNTASDCVYTGQYDELEKLSRRYPGKLIIMAFPSNEFNQQEKGDDNSIAQFCRRNFGVDFMLMKKTLVKKNAGQNSVYQWLTEAGKNGWNNAVPQWNFTKYLVDEQGNLIRIFPPAISPLDEAVLKELK